MKYGWQRAVPVAAERFHDALDELENEVRLAQTVLRRDLALLKQDRKKKEAAAKQHEAEKARLAAESRNAPANTVQEPVKLEKVSTPTPPTMPSPAAQPAKLEEPDQSLKREEEPEPPPPIDTTAADEPERDPLFDGTPTTANPHESEFDFDAIFGDAMDTTGDNNNHDDMMDTAGDMDFNLDDGNDGSSLLRGLEDFAKASNDDNANQTTSMDIDFPMTDLPDLNIIAPPIPDQPSTTKPAEPTTTQPTIEGTKDEKVEPKADTKPATTDNDMMATMAADDLEDLFNMDEYENPENSSFDDAFFNFDN